MTVSGAVVAAWPACGLAILLTLWPGAIHAQTSRDAELTAAKADKARSLRPYEPNRIEEIVAALTAGVPTRIYPSFSGLFEGGGFALGVGYRKFLDDRSFADARTVWSARNFKLFEASFTVPPSDFALGRFPAFHARIGWRDAPEYPFHGIGEDSSPTRRDGQVEETYFAAGGTVRPNGWTFARGEAGVRLMRSGRDDALPLLPGTLAPDGIPGLGASPGYVVSSIDAGIDTRISPGYSSQGGLYHVRHRAYVDRGDRAWSFHQVDVEAVQLVPLVRNHWVLALRAAASLANPFEGDDIPWFMLPALGGSTTLRVYPTARFRDRRTVLAAAEWRTFINRALDLAFFYETGGVARRFQDIESSDLAPSYGIGLRIHGPTFTALRTELAHGREGWRAIFSFGPSF